MMVPERRGAGSVQLAEVGSDLLQDLVMLTQENPLTGDHLAECLCVRWVHVGQLWNRTWGPKCWTQEGRDGVKGTGFIGRQAGSQTGRGPVTGRQSDSQGLDARRVFRQAGVRWHGEN